MEKRKICQGRREPTSKYAGGYTTQIKPIEQTVLSVSYNRPGDVSVVGASAPEFIEVFPWVLHQQSHSSEVCGLTLATQK